VAGWRLPAAQKAVLTTSGIPLLDAIVDMALFGTERSQGKYRLAGTRPGPHHRGCVYLAEPGTGLARFVKSSVNHWLCWLHLVGTWFTTSTVIHTWDEDAAMEAVALTELDDLLHRIKHRDPPAYGDTGDHEAHYWPAVLDRWLY
jgi:hypothetical protein